MGKWIGRLASLLISLTLALIAFEFGWRFLKFRRLTIEAGISDPHYHHRLKPDTTYHFTSPEFDVTVRTNRFGLRGPDPIIPKPAGVVRILVLGDSYTFGFPVRDEETFASLIERQLKVKGFPVEVVNGGVSGYSPTLEYLSLRDQFLTFEPDLVILWYDLGDLQEDQWFQKNLVYDAAGHILRCDPAYTNGRFDRWEWLKTHSLLMGYLDRKFVRTTKYLHQLGFWGLVRTKLKGERAKVALARLKAEQQSEDLAGYDRFLFVRESTTAASIQPYWKLSAHYVLMMRDLLAQRHIPFVLGIYPYGMVVGPDQWADGRVYWGFQKGKTYDPSVALSVFRSFSEHEHIPLVNTYESFRLAARSEKLFYDWDGHMTPAGHRVLAHHLVEDPEFLALLRQEITRLQRK